MSFPRQPDFAASRQVHTDFGVLSLSFTGMADYQFQPDVNDPVVNLRLAMENMDGTPIANTAFVFTLIYVVQVNEISKYQIPEEKEDYSELSDPNAMDIDIDPHLTEGAESSTASRSNLRLIPPPLFSRQNIPQNYKCVPSAPDCNYSVTVHPASKPTTYLSSPLSSTKRQAKKRRG